MESARELFFEQGYTATGIAQILKRSDAKSGSLYHFFPTKEDLLAAVLEKYKAMLQPMVLGPAFERASLPLERIFAVLHGYRQLLEMTEFSLGCPIGNLALEVANSLPSSRKLLEENFEAWRAAIKALIELDRDRFPPDVDFDALSFQVLCTMEGAVMLARAYRRFEPFDAAMQSLRDQFERLLNQGSDWGAPTLSE